MDHRLRRAGRTHQFQRLQAQERRQRLLWLCHREAGAEEQPQHPRGEGDAGRRCRKLPPLPAKRGHPPGRPGLEPVPGPGQHDLRHLPRADGRRLHPLCQRRHLLRALLHRAHHRPERQGGLPAPGQRHPGAVCPECLPDDQPAEDRHHLRHRHPAEQRRNPRGWQDRHREHDRRRQPGRLDERLHPGAVHRRVDGL